MFRKLKDKLKDWDAELLKAVKKGNIERLSECIKHGAKIDKHFHSTCDAINSRRNGHAYYRRDQNPLVIALLNNNIPMLEAIIELIGNKEIQNYPILDEAFYDNRMNLATLNFMIKQGALLDHVLPYAVSYGHLDSTEALLNAGAEINKIYGIYLYPNNGNNQHEHTVLMIAAHFNNADMVKLLLKNGADALVKNSDGRSAEEYTTEYSIKLLIRQAKNPTITIQDTSSPFSDARKEGYHNNSTLYSPTLFATQSVNDGNADDVIYTQTALLRKNS